MIRRPEFGACNGDIMWPVSPGVHVKSAQENAMELANVDLAKHVFVDERRYFAQRSTKVANLLAWTLLSLDNLPRHKHMERFASVERASLNRRRVANPIHEKLFLDSSDDVWMKSAGGVARRIYKLHALMYLADQFNIWARRRECHDVRQMV